MAPVAEFETPPVVEVALSVAFDPLPGLGLIALGDLWATQFRDVFPTVQEHPPYTMPVEPLEGAMPRSLFSFQVNETPPLPRLWFLSATGSELVQVQRDWLARNWRKVDGSGDYPRYAAMRSSFGDALTRLEAYARDRGFGEVRPTQVEITYVDHIEGHSDGTAAIADIAERTNLSSASLPAPERLIASYLITHDGSEAGRLHLEVSPVIRKADHAPLVAITMTARGRPITATHDGVLAFLDVGHEWAHLAFEQLTTGAMQEAWGRK